MALTNRKALQATAEEILEQNKYRAKRTVLLYSGIWAAGLLAVAVINFLLGIMADKMTAGVSGLDALDTVAIMETAQTVLNLAASILPTFWTMGYLFCLLRISAGEPMEDKTLLQGFRAFGPIVRKELLWGLVMTALMTAGFYIGSILVSFTPLAQPMMEAGTLYADLSSLTDQQLTHLLQASAPVLIVCTAVSLLLVIPMTYRLRMSNYILMENPRFGALFSLLASFRMTKGHCLRLFLLELRFWWYYAAMIVATLLSYTAPALPMLGLELAVDHNILNLILYSVSLLIIFCIQYFAANKVEMTFVQAYRELSREAALPITPEPTEQPRQNPFA